MSTCLLAFCDCYSRIDSHFSGLFLDVLVAFTCAGLICYSSSCFAFVSQTKRMKSQPSSRSRGFSPAHTPPPFSARSPPLYIPSISHRSLAFVFVIPGSVSLRRDPLHPNRTVHRRVVGRSKSRVVSALQEGSYFVQGWGGKR